MRYTIQENNLKKRKRIPLFNEDLLRCDNSAHKPKKSGHCKSAAIKSERAKKAGSDAAQSTDISERPSTVMDRITDHFLHQESIFEAS